MTKLWTSLFCSGICGLDCCPLTLSFNNQAMEVSICGFSGFGITPYTALSERKVLGLGLGYRVHAHALQFGTYSGCFGLFAEGPRYTVIMNSPKS